MKNLNVVDGVEILFGKEGIKQAYKRSLVSDKLDIVCLSESYSLVIGKYFDKEYSPKLFNSQIKTREILPDKKENRHDAVKKDGRKNQVKFIQIGQKSESDFILSDSQLVLISYNPDNPYALVVNDKELVANFQNQFENLWNRL